MSNKYGAFAEAMCELAKELNSRIFVFVLRFWPPPGLLMRTLSAARRITESASSTTGVLYANRRVHIALGGVGQVQR